MARPDLRPATLALLLLAASSEAANLYCCTDKTGRRSCGDTLPEACYGRAYKVIGPSGAVVREVEAPLTPAQRAQKEAEIQRQKTEDEARREQRRKDQALLDTYTSVADIDAMAANAERGLAEAIKQSETKIGEIRKRRKKFEAEAEFYPKKPLPAEVRKGLQETDAEIAAQQETIANRQKERDTVRAKYEADKRRYLELTSKPAPAH